MAAAEIVPLGIRIFCDSLINKCTRIIGGGGGAELLWTLSFLEYESHPGMNVRV
jgi:hypothetical protein